MEQRVVRRAARAAAVVAVCVASFPAAAIPAAVPERGSPIARATVEMRDLARIDTPAARTIAPDPLIEREQTAHASEDDDPEVKRRKRSKNRKARKGSARDTLSGPAIASSFLGLDDDGTAIPPDTHGAVGPRHLMVTLNSQFRVMTRKGKALETMSINAFWSKLGAPKAFDPKVLYDPYSERWIVTACGDSRSATSSVLLAVSAGKDPTGKWYQWRLDADEENVVWADYPSIGFNDRWVVIQMNMFTNSGSVFSRSDMWVFDKQDLYRNGPGDFAHFEQNGIGDTLAPGVAYEPDTAEMHFVRTVSGDVGGTGRLQLFTLSGPVASPRFDVGPVVDVPFTFAMSTTGRTDIAAQLDIGKRLSNGDARMQAVVFRGGSLWATHTVFLPAGAEPQRTAVAWYELTPGGQLRQAGLLDHPKRFYAYPSIAVNKRGDALIGYSRFSDGQFASANFAFRYANDPPGTVRGDTVFKQGEDSYFKTFGGTRNRWGDYSATMPDPLNDVDFWTIQQFADRSRDGADRWGTWWARVVPRASPALTVDLEQLEFGSTLAGTTSAAQTLTVTNGGTAPLRVRSLRLAGKGKALFDVAEQTCTGGRIEPDATCTIELTFTPSGAGERAASLKIASDGSKRPVVVPLQGEGIRDTTAPGSAFVSPDNMFAVGGTTIVEGTSEDDLAGIESVVVTFTQVGRSESPPVTVRCGDAGRSCTWTVRVPTIPGTYEVRAIATDRAGFRESPGPVITVNVA